MKQTLSVLSLAVCAAASAQETSPAPAPIAAAATDISLRGSMAWNGKNVFRGIERSDTDGLVQSALTIDYSPPGSAGLSLYANFFNADGMERTFTFGARRDFAFGDVDVGVQRLTGRTIRTLAADGYIQIESNPEFYIGASYANANLTPSVYAYYSSELAQFTTEIAGSKTVAGSLVGLAGFDVVIKLYGGLTAARASVHAGPNSYSYLGASFDLTRQVARGSEIGIGLNFADNSDGQAQTSGSTVWTRVFANLRF